MAHYRDDRPLAAAGQHQQQQTENIMSALLERFSKWLQLKIYQIEVTFCVYIFTPAEKFIFWSVAFLLVSLTSLAAILYLPQHILFIVGRAWYYINGEGAVTKEVITEVVKEAATGTGTGTLAEALKATAEVVREL